MRDKHTKFIELAEKRTTRALREIDLIANLANKANYSYTPEEVEIIFNALYKAMELSKSRFRIDDPRNFSLKK